MFRKRNLVIVIICILSILGGIIANAAEIVANHADDQSFYMVMYDRNGDPNTSITVTTLNMFYVEDGATSVSVGACSDLTAENAAHTDGGAYEIGTSGLYRFDFPDAAFDGGINKRVTLWITDDITGTRNSYLTVMLSPPVNIDAIDSNNLASQNAHAFYGNVGAGDPYERFEDMFDTTKVSIATIYSDPHTQANLETYSQTGADAALVALGLDHLTVSTGVAAGGDLTTYVADLSILGHLISNADTSTYSSATDSLKILSDNQTTIAGYTDDIGVAGVGLTEAGGDGDHLTAINLPNQTMDITGSLSGAVGSVTGAVGSVTGAVGSVTGAVGSVTGAVGSVAGNVDGNVSGSVGSNLDLDSTAEFDAYNATVVTAVGVIETAATAAKTAAEKIDTASELRTLLVGTNLPLAAGLNYTTIATLASQTSFTLTAGSANNDAYNGCTIIIQDVSTAAQVAVGTVSDYTGSSKTVTLGADPLAAFVMEATDKVLILPGTSISVAALADIGDAVRGEPLTSAETVNTLGWYIRLVGDLQF